MTCVLSTVLSVNAQTINGGFETNGGIAPGGIGFPDTTSVADFGWQTDNPANTVEVWGSGFGGVQTSTGNGLLAGGDFFAEVNSNAVASLFQEITFTASGSLDYSFLHRGRGANNPSTDPITTVPDVLSFDIIDVATGTSLLTRVASTDGIIGNDANEASNGWIQYSGSDAVNVTAGQALRFEFNAISTGTGDDTTGNFIDSLNVGFNIVPEPSSSLMAAIGGMAFLLRRKRS